jgi:hypothetical protein
MPLAMVQKKLFSLQTGSRLLSIMKKAIKQDRHGQEAARRKTHK